MPTELFLVPLGDNKVPDLQLLDAEAFAYASGTINRDINHTFYQTGASPVIPAGYDSIFNVKEVFNNDDPPIHAGWKLEALKNETVDRMYGGYTLIAPARAGLPLALVRINSTQSMLDTLNTRLRALVVVSTSNFYGRLPVNANAATRENIASKSDEMAADVLIARPNVSAALTRFATTIRGITTVDWQVQLYDAFATLFQLPSRKSIEQARVGEPKV